MGRAMPVFPAHALPHQKPEWKEKGQKAGEKENTLESNGQSYAVFHNKQVSFHKCCTAKIEFQPRNTFYKVVKKRPQKQQCRKGNVGENQNTVGNFYQYSPNDCGVNPFVAC